MLSALGYVPETWTIFQKLSSLPPVFLSLYYQSLYLSRCLCCSSIRMSDRHQVHLLVSSLVSDTMTRTSSELRGLFSSWQEYLPSSCEVTLNLVNKLFSFWSSTSREVVIITLEPMSLRGIPLWSHLIKASSSPSHFRVNFPSFTVLSSSPSGSTMRTVWAETDVQDLWWVMQSDIKTCQLDAWKRCCRVKRDLPGKCYRSIHVQANVIASNMYIYLQMY